MVPATSKKSLVPTNICNALLIVLTKSVLQHVESLKTHLLTSEVAVQQCFAAIEELLSSQKSISAGVKRTRDDSINSNATAHSVEAQLESGEALFSICSSSNNNIRKILKTLQNIPSAIPHATKGLKIEHLHKFHYTKNIF
jgi:hypothetical protein